MTQRYVNLHSHSEYSFLDGYASIDSMISRAKEIGAPAVAITDHGDVAGHISMYKKALAADIKPILGMEGYLIDQPVGFYREQKLRNFYSHIILLAENNIGLSNLWSLSTKAYKDSFYYNPLAHWDMLAEHASGLIATDGCLLSYMAKAIIADDTEKCLDLIGKYIDTFGRDNFFMELHTWQFIDPRTEREQKLNDDMAKVNQGKVALATKYNIPLIVVNDSHYAHPDDWENHALVWEISTHNDGDKTDSGQTAAWSMTDEEIYQWMSRFGIQRSVIEQAIDNTAAIAERCNVTIEPKLRVPSVTGAPDTDRSLFLDHIEEGFHEKVTLKGLDEAVYMERLENELELILGLDFDGYFNVVADYTKFAKKRLKMLVGASRGSSGGSLVAYLLDINEIDPIHYGLIFERFINRGRGGGTADSLPDIDLDFPQSRRGEVLQYLVDKYGAMNVCAVGTISRSQLKGTLKDLCRVLKVPFEDANAMSKIIDQVGKYDPDDEDPESPSLAQLIEEKSKDLLPWLRKYPKLFEKLGEMEGMVRQSGSHASGVLVSNDSFLGILPLRVKKSDNRLVSQFENSVKFGEDVAWLGFVKLDVLGLRHLDTLQVARDLVYERHGKWIDYYKFGPDEYEDPAIYEEMALGRTLGLFQIETPSAAPVCARWKPQNERDVAALIAANRPGVIDAGMLDELIDRRHGLKIARTPHPMMEGILAETELVILYQEQIMAIVQQLAGYSLEEADSFRKAMGKKLADKMKSYKEDFIKRCLENEEFARRTPVGKRPETVARQIWDLIEPSAGYSFNKSHSQGYALLTCWEAWMKHYYPLEFYTALMSTDPEKIPQYVAEAQRKGVQILPPDINESGEHFTATDEGIRYGLTAIKGLGQSAYEAIKFAAPFSGLDDILDRVPKSSFNSAVGTNLISIGALDRFGPRAKLLEEFYTQRKIKNKEIPDFYDDAVVGQIEKSLVGSYITRDPIRAFADIIEQECIQTVAEMDDLLPNEIVNIGGLISKVRPYRDKKGGQMGWITIDWRGEMFEITVFSDKYSGVKHFLDEDAPVVCQVERLKKGVHLKNLLRLDRMEATV
jgi:DNA polymerase-3 subunit alpha